MHYFSKLIFYALIFIACNISVASAGTFKSSYTSSEYGHFAEDIIIEDGAIVDYENFYLDRSLRIENRGTLDTHIHLCPTCRLYIQNSGNLNVTYDAGAASRLTQIITSDDEIKPIGVKSGFEIEVLNNNDNKISMKKLFNYGIDASKLTLNNAVLVYDLDDSVNLDLSQIVLIGDIIVYVNSADDVKDKDILTNVSGSGQVLVYSMDGKLLFSVESKVEDNNVHTDLVHETDYDKTNDKTNDENAEKDPMMAFLDLLRQKKPDSKLLQRLDSTYDMAEFNRILHESVITNPINLMRPIREFNAMKLYADFSNHNLSNLNIVPVYMTSNDFYLAGLQLAISGRVSDSVNISAAVYGAYGDYSDDLDDYSMMTFGGNVGLKYDNDHFVFRNLIGGGYSIFDPGLVFDGKKAITKPAGMNFYGASDIGYRFHLSDNINILPFIGAVADYETVEKFHDFDFRGRGGGEISYHTNGAEINYEYSVMAAYETDGAMNFVLRVGALSEFDTAGADVSIGVRHDEFTTAYQIMLNGKIAF